MVRIVVVKVPTDEASGAFNPFEGVSPNKMIDYVNTEKYQSVWQQYINFDGN